MNQNNNIVTAIKHIKPKSLIFPALFIIYVVVLALIFTGSTKKLAREINNVFADIPRENLYAVDITKYSLVAQKIGLPAYVEPSAQTIVPSDTTNLGTTPTSTDSSTTPDTTTSTSTTPTTETTENPSTDSDSTTNPTSDSDLDPGMLSVAVYNASGVTGLAGKLKTQLETTGFSVITVGNAEAQSQTTLSIKDSKKAYIPMITSELLEFNLITQSLPEDSELDAVITIGENL
jgi:hypothetical protein